MDFLKPIPELVLQKIKLLSAQHLHVVPPQWSVTFLSSSALSVLRQGKHKHLATANITSDLQNTDFGKGKKKTNKRQRTPNLWRSTDQWCFLSSGVVNKYFLSWFPWSDSNFVSTAFCYVIRYTVDMGKLSMAHFTMSTVETLESFSRVLQTITGYW